MRISDWSSDVCSSDLEVPDPFSAHLSWHVPQPLSLDLLELASDPFLGEHDFSAFCRRPKVDADQEPPSLVRRILSAGWDDLGEGVLRFAINGPPFCHQLLRSVFGTFVAPRHGQAVAAALRGTPPTAYPP